MKNTEGKYFEFYERLEKLLDYHIKFLNHTILVDVFDDNMYTFLNTDYLKFSLTKHGYQNLSLNICGFNEKDSILFNETILVSGSMILLQPGESFEVFSDKIEISNIPIGKVDLFNDLDNKESIIKIYKDFFKTSIFSFAENPMLFARAKYIWLKLKPDKENSGYPNLKLILNFEDEDGNLLSEVVSPFSFLRMLPNSEVGNYKIETLKKLWSSDLSEKMRSEKITIKSPSYVDFGLLKDISPLLENQYKEIVLLTISNFELFTSSEGYKETVRFDYLNSLMNFLFPPKFGDVANSNFTQERSYVNFNHLLMNKSQRKMLGYDLDSNKFKEHKDSGGFVVSFYCKYYNELVNSIKDDGGNVKKEKVNLILNFLEFAIETGINENYFTINTIQNIFELINKLKEVFPDTKSPLISISKSKYPETYSFLNTMINVVDFDSFKYNDDLKTYYDRNDVILRYETLEAPKLVTKEELLKYLCLDE